MDMRRQHGFTLWELLMTLLVAGILLGIGVPNVMEFSRNAGMTAAANDIVTGVLMARSEAVKRQAPVTLCLTDDPTAADPTCEIADVTDSTMRGFIVFVDDNDNFNADGSRNLLDATDGNAARDDDELVLMEWEAPGAPILLSADCGYVTFAPTGFTRQAGGGCFPAIRSILLCDDRGSRMAGGTLSSARAVQIDRPGRPQALSEVAAVNAVIAALDDPTCP
jgi:prepilin-type N-terminal cleavage/methylation domain-containing protein